MSPRLLTVSPGLREGVAVLAEQSDVLPAVTDVAQIQREYGCHPNFAGYGWTKMPTAAASDARALSALRKQVQRHSPHAFAIVRSSSGLQVAETSNATGLPMVMLAQPKGSATEMLSGIATLGHALMEQAEAETAFLIAVDVCTLSYGQARLQAYAGLMFGASGVIFTNVTTGLVHCSKTGQQRSETINERLRFAAPINDALAQWQAMLRQSGPLAWPKVKMVHLVSAATQSLSIPVRKQHNATC